MQPRLCWKRPWKGHEFPEICPGIARESDNWHKSMLTIKCYNNKFLFLLEVITTFTQKAIPCDTPAICHHSPYHSYIQGFFHEGGNQWITNHRTVLFVFVSLPAFSNGSSNSFSVFSQKQYQQMVTPSPFVLFYCVTVLHFNNDHHISVSSLATFIILTSFSTTHWKMYLLDETKSSTDSTTVDGFSHAVVRNWIFLLQCK